MRRSLERLHDFVRRHRAKQQEQSGGTLSHLGTHLPNEVVVYAVAAEVGAQCPDGERQVISSSDIALLRINSKGRMLTVYEAAQMMRELGFERGIIRHNDQIVKVWRRGIEGGRQATYIFNGQTKMLTRMQI